ncbi:hypothetical protein [Streptomyces sp. NPDC052015]|uniref:hypothetical protein n=1 Tax=Streptomyces sp. NPDC052015 TaxID=3154755 RepID=UPI00343B2EC5
MSAAPPFGHALQLFVDAGLVTDHAGTEEYKLRLGDRWSEDRTNPPRHCGR